MSHLRASLLPRLPAALTALAIMVAACASPLGSPAAWPSDLVESSSPPSASLDVAIPPACGAATEAPAASGPWWRDRTFYEVFVRSFADSNGDGIGDLRGLTAKLDYLNDGNPATTTDLGVTGIWLMPVAQSASYHGYDVTDYQSVESDYGTTDDFHALVAAAHARGIGVVVDLVLNHTSSRHPWFQDALAGGAHRDWYTWSATDPGWPNPIGGGDPWHPSRAGYYYGVFSDSMPDLNLRNPAVTAETRRIARFWLDDMGANGFRLDAAKHLIEDGPDAQVNTPETHAWLAGFRNDVHADKPGSLVLGEVADSRQISSGYTAEGSLDMAFDFEIGPAIATAVRIGDPVSLLINQAEIATSYAAGGAGTFLSNHDQPRIMTELQGDESAARQAAAALLTGPGVPFLYYGEELGMMGHKPDEQIRTPFPWTSSGPGFGFTSGTPWEPAAAGAERANFAGETADPSSLLSTYRDLVHLRAEHPALSVGDFAPVGASNPKVLASIRSNGAERLLVVQNLSPDAADGVSLELRSAQLCGTPGARVIHASAGAPRSAAAPMISPDGGFAGYVPFPRLPGRATVVIQLSP